MAADQNTHLSSNALVLVNGLGGYLVTLSITFEVAPIIKNNPSELRVKLWAIFCREKLNLLYGLFFTAVTVVHPEQGGTKSGAQSCSVYQYPLPRASQFIRECETIIWFPMLAAVVSYLVTLEQTIRWIIRGNWWIINHSNEKQLCTLTQLFVINSNAIPSKILADVAKTYVFELREHQLFTETWSHMLDVTF